jgi:Recombinase
MALREKAHPDRRDHEAGPEIVGHGKRTPRAALGLTMAVPWKITDMLIVEFCDKIMYIELIKCANKNCKFLSDSRRISAFLTQHPSVKTTADLTPRVIEDFVATCEGLSPSRRSQLLERLRTFSNMAMEWGCLSRNPFETYPLPKVKTLKRPFEKLRPNSDEISRLMAYLESRKDTWTGHRLYAFTATVLHAGLTPREAMKLTLPDCDLARGVIRVPGRAESCRSKYPPEVPISPPLAEILSGWIPAMLKGFVRQGGHPPYGSKRAEDGRGYVLDESQQQVLADMFRWLAEGMSVRQITRELNSRGIPTKRGKTGWNRASVTMILNRAGRPDSHAVDPASEPSGRKKDRDEGYSQFVFPILRYGDAHPTRERSNGNGSRMGSLTDACKVLKIKVTFASLRRWYLEHTRLIVDTERNDREPGAGRVETTRQRTSSVATWSPGRCPVTIVSDEIVMVSGKIKNPTYPQYNVIKALVDAGPSGLSGDELIAKSGRLGYRNILRTLARDEDWSLRIRLAGLPHGRYRLSMPGDK